MPYNRAICNSTILKNKNLKTKHKMSKNSWTQFEDFSPRPAPSPHPSSVQSSVRPTVPDVSVMDGESCVFTSRQDEYEKTENPDAVLELFDKLLANKDDWDDEDSSYNSIERNRKDVTPKATDLNNTTFLEFNHQCRNCSGKRSGFSRIGDSCWFDSLEITDNSDCTLSSPGSIHFDLPNNPLTVNSSTPKSFHRQNSNIENQFSPIPEESYISQFSDDFFHMSQSKENIKPKRTKHSSVSKTNSSQNLPKTELSFQMNRLAEKYLPNRQQHRPLIQHQAPNLDTSDALKYSFASEKYLLKHGLLPKNYKRETNEFSDTSSIDFSIATCQYMEKHGLMKKKRQK